MMKKLVLFCLIIVSYTIYSCKEDPVDPTRLPVSLVDREIVEMSSDLSKKYEIKEDTIWNQLVVRFDENADPSSIDNLKQEIFDEFPLKEPAQTCSCGDQMIELWTFNDQIDLNGAIGSMERSGGGGEGDFQFVFTLPDAQRYEKQRFTEEEIDTAQNHLQIKLNPGVKTDLSRVNIAVIDTGAELFNYYASEPYLYSTEGDRGLGCEGEKIGWNFVDSGSSDVQANHEHGPIINAIIKSELKDEVPFSILPVKSFNEKGKSTYWEMVCAMAYVKDLQKKNNDIHFVNASFGFTFSKYTEQERDSLLKHQTILKDLIKELEELSTVVITSSGNEGEDNNQPEFYHFPSGYNTTGPTTAGDFDPKDFRTNIVGVGGFKGLGPEMQTQGNYGSHSIDLAARFGIYEVTVEFDSLGITYSQKLKAKGTSFGTAYVTARMSKFLQEQSGGSVINLSEPWKLKTDYFSSGEVPRNSIINFATRIKEGKYTE